MLKSVICTYCSTPHHDHWECSECGKRIGGLLRPSGDSGEFTHCPYCGRPLIDLEIPCSVNLYPIPQLCADERQVYRCCGGDMDGKPVVMIEACRWNEIVEILLNPLSKV